MIAQPWLAIILGALLVGVMGAVGWQGYQMGRDSVIAAQAKASEKQRAQVESIEKRSRAATQQTGHAIEANRNERSAEADHARDIIGPVRVCSDTARAEMPGAAEPAATTDSTEGGTGLPVRTGDSAEAPAVVPDDIGPGLVALVRACQRDHDDDRFWREWWESQAALAAPSF